MIDDLLNWENLSPAERRALSAKLDRLTARFAYCVIAALGVLVAFNVARWALS